MFERSNLSKKLNKHMFVHKKNMHIRDINTKKTIYEYL